MKKQRTIETLRSIGFDAPDSHDRMDRHFENGDLQMVTVLDDGNVDVHFADSWTRKWTGLFGIQSIEQFLSHEEGKE